MLQLTDNQARFVYDRLVERLSMIKLMNATSPSEEGKEVEVLLVAVLDDISNQVDVSPE